MKTTSTLKTWIALLSTLSCLGAAAPAHAHSPAGTVTNTYSGFGVGGAETRSLQLSGWQHVKKIIVRADGTWHSGMVEVFANGDVKGSLYVPGSDPSYVVTIDETVSSIEFRNTSNSTIAVREITVVSVGEAFHEVGGRPGTVSRNRIPTSREELEIPTRLSLPALQETTALARRAMEIVEILEPFANYADDGQYLLPIKKAAARAYAKARGAQPGSTQVAQALAALAAQIEFAAPYIEDGFERSGAFEYATELLSLKETIQGYLN